MHRQHLNQYIHIYLHREYRKTSFIRCFDRWFFHFSVHGDRQRNNTYLQHCWVITGGTYDINGLMDLLHWNASNQIEQIQIPMRIWRKPNLWLAIVNLWMWLKLTFWLDQVVNYFPEGQRFLNIFCAWPIWHASSKQNILYTIMRFFRSRWGSKFMK